MCCAPKPHISPYRGEIMSPTSSHSSSYKLYTWVFFDVSQPRGGRQSWVIWLIFAQRSRSPQCYRIWIIKADQDLLRVDASSLFNTANGLNGPFKPAGPVRSAHYSISFVKPLAALGIQPADIGWPTGNGKKLSNSQACCLAQLCLIAA